MLLNSPVGCMARRIFFLVTVIWALAEPDKCMAQLLSQSWKQIDQSAGISEMQNAFLTADLLGRLWISSMDGLNCFDGKQVKQIRFTLPNGQSDPIISSKMFRDAQGNLWCTTAGGIHCLKNGSFKTDSWQIKVGPDSVPASYHYGIHLERDSLLWVTADDQLFLFNIKTKQFCFLHDLQAVRCYPILNKDGVVKGLAVSFFGTGIEIIDYKDNGQPLRQFHFQAGNTAQQPVAKVYNFILEGDSLAWIPSSIGLLRFNLKNKSFNVFCPDQCPKGIVFCDAAIWKKDWLWLTSVGHGIYLFSKKEFRFIANEKFLWVENQAHDVQRTNNLYVDPRGTIWLANWKKEILYANFSGIKFQHHLKKEALAHTAREVSTIASDSAGNVWCAIRGEGLYQIKKDANPALNSQGGLASFYSKMRSINHLYQDDKDNLWQLSNNIVSCLDISTGRNQTVYQAMTTTERLFDYPVISF